MAQILDYSAGYPPAQVISEAGYQGVIRYLRKEGTSRVKPITPAEAEDMKAHGCDVALVYQHVSQSRVTEGRAAGEHDAHWALARAAELGLGDPRALYFAVDFDAVPSTVDAYFRGTLSVIGVGRNGAYGSDKVLRYLFDRGLITFGWQTAAWSGGRREARAHLYQRIAKDTVGGVTCDVNDVLATDYGQYSHNAIDGDDMEASDMLRAPFTNPNGTVPTYPVGDWLTYANKYAGEAASDAAACKAMLAELIATSHGDDVDASAVLQRVDTAIRESTAAAVTNVVLPALRTVVSDVLGDDNAEQADAIVTKLAERLRPTTDTPEGE